MDQSKEQETRQHIVPRCQYCGAEPMPLIPAFTKIGTGEITVFICSACGATHGVQLTGVSEQPKQESKILVPGKM